MKRFSLHFLIVAITIFLSACGSAAATPTMSVEDIQSTAVAAAFTIIAQTQASIPTNTPLPPTETPLPTPLPTDTPVPLPTVDPATIPTLTAPTVAPSSGPGGDPCNAALAGDVSGHPTQIKLENMTKGDLVISLYLNKTAFGECGFRGYNLGPRESTTITDLPQGCYNVSVFVTEGNKSSKAFGYGCLNNPDQWSFFIYADNVVFAGK